MKLIIKEVYSNFRVDKNSKAIFVGMLQGVLEGQQLDTLDYFVVTDPEAGEFEKAVSKYACTDGDADGCICCPCACYWFDGFF